MPRFPLPRVPAFLHRGVALGAVLSAAAGVSIGAAQAGSPAPAAAPTTSAAPAAGWNTRLMHDLARVSAGHSAGIGVYVRDLETGVAARFQSSESWYLASTVKVPVAIAVLRGIERGQYKLDTTVTLEASDYVDGAGLTNRNPVGSALTIRYLIDQMIVYSDNTASDMLIGLVGVDELNALVRELVPEGFGRITRLAEVRRLAYGNLTPAARRLSGRELIQLNRQRSDADRLQMLSRFTGTPVAQFRLPSLEEAYDAYYASGLNSARLDAYGELLARLAQGQALAPASTDYLLRVMERVATGTHRIKAGLPPAVAFAHKTGTQRRRFCDAGITYAPAAGPPGAAPTTPPHAGHPQRAVVVACTRDELSLQRSESALRQIGAAVCRSGLVTQGVVNAPSCPVVVAAAGGAARLPADPAEER